MSSAEQADVKSASMRIIESFQRELKQMLVDTPRDQQSEVIAEAFNEIAHYMGYMSGYAHTRPYISIGQITTSMVHGLSDGHRAKMEMMN